MKNVRHDYGIDGGNLYNKLNTGKGEYALPTVYVPNIVITDKFTKADNLEGNLVATVTTRIDNDHKKKELGTFEFGYRALRNNVSKCRDYGVAKHKDDNLLAIMLNTLCYGYLKDNYVKKGNDDSKIPRGRIDVRLNLGTGLPYKEFVNEENSMEIMVDRLKGTHRLYYPIYDLEIVLLIENVHVDVEGNSALDLYLYDEQGNYKVDIKSLLNKIIILFDIGGYTIEAIAMKVVEDFADIMATEGQIRLEYVDTMCDGVENGVAFCYQKVIRELEANPEYRSVLKRKLNIYDIETAMKRYGGVLPEGINIAPLVEKYTKELDIEFAGWAKNLISANNAESLIAKFLLAGGSSQTLGSELVNQVIAYGIPSKVIEPLPNAFTGNAKGYRNNAVVNFPDPTANE